VGLDGELSESEVASQFELGSDSENCMFSKIQKWFNDRKEIKEDLYIKILLWAYKRQETGFTIEEIRPTFLLSQEQDTWMRKIFLTTSDKDRKFFEHVRDDDSVKPNRRLYALNEKGLSFATNYLALKQSEKSSNMALFFASASLLIAAPGLFYQVKQTSLAESQGISERIQQARSVERALEFCNQNPQSDDSGLYEVDTGKPASCTQIIEQYKNPGSLWDRLKHIF
jgi:hypothetical protein